MDAVGCVNLQSGLAFFRHHFVDRCGTKVLAGIGVLAHAAITANIRIEDDEMAGLIFFMARAGVIDVGEAIEGELTVAFEARGLVDKSA